ncbi:MAG: thioredoxin-disulfide reductase [Bacteroidales bacterium]|nr:thioredoxin-disulfide reductase [Bacteroidales bacterium]
MEQQNKYDIIVIGGGPAGLTAGLYASRAKVKVLILNEGIAGGQMSLTHEVANYPGIEKISGYMMSRNMQKQAESFGCIVKSNIKVTNIDLKGIIKKVTVNKKETYESKAVIIATGGKSKEIGVEGEKEFAGRGISYCATCDGDFFQDKEIIVVGGGNSALEEAISLTQYASKVTIIHQFNYFQAYKHAIEAAQNHEKISFILESTITGFYGSQSLEKVKIKSSNTGIETEMKIDGVFIFIGYVPQTKPFKNIIKLNERGEILADENLETNIKGVFAAGDCREKIYRQITTAVSDGTIAALNAIEYIQS